MRKKEQQPDSLERSSKDDSLAKRARFSLRACAAQQKHMKVLCQGSPCNAPSFFGGAMLIRELVSLIERIAPPRMAADWDHSGVQVAARATEISRLAVTLDPIPETVAQALDWGAQFILAHHPLAKTPRFPDRLDILHETLRLVLSKGAWLYAAHTPLDCAPNGPAAWLAEELGLTRREILDPCGADPADAYGFGLIGDLPVAQPIESFLDKIWALVPRSFLTFIGKTPERARRVAYCTGSGSSLAWRAFAQGADVYLTGDVTHHTALDIAPLGLTIDCGHQSLEAEMMRRLTDTLAEKTRDASLEIRFFESADPLRAALRP